MLLLCMPCSVHDLDHVALFIDCMYVCMYVYMYVRMYVCSAHIQDIVSVRFGHISLHPPIFHDIVSWALVLSQQKQEKRFFFFLLFLFLAFVSHNVVTCLSLPVFLLVWVPLGCLLACVVYMSKDNRMDTCMHTNIQIINACANTCRKALVTMQPTYSPIDIHRHMGMQYLHTYSHVCIYIYIYIYIYTYTHTCMHA
jgi:hypothetical protein